MIGRMDHVGDEQRSPRARAISSISDRAETDRALFPDKNGHRARVIRITEHLLEKLSNRFRHYSLGLPF
jgi:hypothetical protein